MCHNEISFWDCTVHFYTSILWFNYISGPLPSQLHSWECDWWSMCSICDQSVTIWIIPSMCTYLFHLQWSLGNSRHGCIVGDPNDASTPHPKQCCGLFLKKSLSLMFYISFVLSHVPAPMDEDVCLSGSDNDIFCSVLSCPWCPFCMLICRAPPLTTLSHNPQNGNSMTRQCRWSR